MANMIWSDKDGVMMNKDGTLLAKFLQESDKGDISSLIDKLKRLNDKELDRMIHSLLFFIH